MYKPFHEKKQYFIQNILFIFLYWQKLVILQTHKKL